MAHKTPGAPPTEGASTPEAEDTAPDAATPYDGDDFFLGGEAAVPPGEYGPPIVSVLPPLSERSGEFRELERRVQARVSPVFPIEHRRRLPMAFLWKRYRRYAMRNRSARVDDFGRDPVYAARIEALLDLLYSRWFRVETRGIENVPDTGRALLVGNHSGMLPYDGVMVMYAMHSDHPARRDVRPLVEDFVFHFPYVGTFINRIGGVRACQSNAERLLGRDEVIVVFPEGLKGVGKLWRQRYQLQRFGRGGFVKLALRARAPIVPVAIIGAEEAHPILAKFTWPAAPTGLPYLPLTPTFPLLGPLGLLPLPAKWFIHFGEPIDLPGTYGPDAADDRILVNKLADTVRSRIQDMVDQARTQRRSIVFG
ncbi:lysophospholipid acyltransferase family protein [Haliangium sp.]|uniref:lysophospholipid acyltransferase family protein n=1 Tax=Haliangium sp. TaxID=2663208 RepID=UPI003D129DBE